MEKMRLKSMDPLLEYFAMRPSASVVVADPRILGPMMEKIVDAIAKTIMTVS